MHNISILSMTSTTACTSFVVKNSTSFTGNHSVLFIICIFYTWRT
jgi:hypothetical protein